MERRDDDNAYADDDVSFACGILLNDSCSVYSNKAYLDRHFKLWVVYRIYATLVGVRTVPLCACHISSATLKFGWILSSNAKGNLCNDYRPHYKQY